VHLPVRSRAGVHRVLRSLPGARGRATKPRATAASRCATSRLACCSRVWPCWASRPRSACEPRPRSDPRDIGPAATAARHATVEDGRRAGHRRAAVVDELAAAVRHAAVRLRRAAPAQPLRRGGRCVRCRPPFYATKAFLCTAMARLAYEEGMHLDVASGGELYVALRAGVPANALAFHGNNKSVAELRMAITEGVRHIVVDSFDELDRIEALHAQGLPAPKVLAPHHPGVHAHTPRVHRHRPGRQQVRLQPRQRRRGAAVDRMRRSPAWCWRACTATSAATCSRPRTSPRLPR
jgi:hypothetical protein